MIERHDDVRGTGFVRLPDTIAVAIDEHHASRGRAAGE
jgi:hypothetical protein